MKPYFPQACNLGDSPWGGSICGIPLSGLGVVDQWQRSATFTAIGVERVTGWSFLGCPCPPQTILLTQMTSLGSKKVKCGRTGGPLGLLESLVRSLYGGLEGLEGLEEGMVRVLPTAAL